MEVLAGLQAARPEPEQPLFNQVILAAPDIDRDVFLELAKQVHGVAEGITYMLPRRTSHSRRQGFTRVACRVPVTCPRQG
jgi:esterase/lipase superfamily enzyme